MKLFNDECVVPLWWWLGVVCTNRSMMFVCGLASLVSTNSRSKTAILHMDSLGETPGLHGGMQGHPSEEIHRHLLSYLNQEWRARKRTTGQSFSPSTIPLVKAKVGEGVLEGRERLGRRRNGWRGEKD